MKSAILISPGVLEISTKAIEPVPGPGEVVVKIKAALTCGTDLKAYLRGHPKIPMPSPLGHEYSGDIYKVGDGVEGFPVGTPVMGVHSAPCGECFYCARGLDNLCGRVMEDKVLGAYSEYIKLPANVVKRNLFVKPERLSYEEAAMLEPLSCVVHGLGLVRRLDYKNVLILGAGPVGLMHLMLNKAAGKKVIVAGRRPNRLKMAKELGADLIVDASLDGMAWSVMEATDGLGADLVIEATGNKDVWENAPKLVRKGGSVLLFGGCPPDTKVCFDASRLHYDEITLIGAFHFSPSDVKDAYDMLAEGRIDVKRLISGSYPLAQLKTAFESLIAGHGIKYSIIP